ncbi:sigma-54-dependent Fis family transcriptional regulator [Paucibacter sp. APW11]|uniref:Sigma-54-dependent Fis family transcriptional regulator n=1 Tax=Roseateles aquae TaxID=3077235 RepID=A0ABU3PCK1_9BURK|nr:sigma-54-dependent Fis family transcriptional regulator [Paucibacter sp. APW11]MDT9000315.1 sigma-54-dependent Fis family transcriptional regulator [Paucibacter sp. APW11]
MQALPSRIERSARLREARRALLDAGQVADGLIAPALLNSWQRSQAYGLRPEGRPPGAPHASGAQLARALEQQRELVAHARPVMEHLFRQTAETDSMVILADAEGLLLQALGDASFLDRAQRVALRPGASWHEQWRGTNAIGTALADAAPVVVHGGEHYLERNGFLTCTAAPILDPSGRVLGALDISGEQRSYHRHTLALVRTAAGMIEQRLFEHRHGAGLRLHLHGQAEGIGSCAEGLLALSDEGWLIGANAAALQMLGLGWSAIGACRIEQLLPLQLDQLADWCRRPSSAPRLLRRADGSTLWLRVDAGRSLLAASTAVPARSAAVLAPPADALARLDSGDPALRQALERARRVMNKPIALLLQGESGVGKELFVRALHASSARAGGPLVALNCAALPEALIEAELFGYRPGAFTGAARQGAPGRIREAEGGTLFLDEIGDMPLALQARLLRVLQERQVQALGGGAAVAVDFRLVCASHRELAAEVEAGRFRADLYYRLNGLTLRLPPLRERQDLPALIERMLAELQPARPLQLAPELLQALQRYRWPGNLRQLHNALQTACALLDDDEPQIDFAHLPDDLLRGLRAMAAAAAPGVEAAERDGAGEESIDGTGQAAGGEAGPLRAQARHRARQTVQACEGNLSLAARRLGISRNTLYRLLREAAGAASAPS